MKHTWETMQLDVKGNRMVVKHTRDLEGYLEKDNVPTKRRNWRKEIPHFFLLCPKRSSRGQWRELWVRQIVFNNSVYTQPVMVCQLK